ncbi:MAG: tetratricopeptide repeat protein, partial [Planctomycetes bacterium]|nr:tetratricopeptide repeat protein [Planctomycetota bacterium]
MMRPSALCTFVFALACGLAPAQDVIADAKRALAAEEFAKALELLEGAYDDIKGDKLAMGLLAESALKAGRFGRAIEYSAKFADMDEANPRAHRLGALSFYWRAQAAKEEPG